LEGLDIKRDKSVSDFNIRSKDFVEVMFADGIPAKRSLLVGTDEVGASLDECKRIKDLKAEMYIN
jgi:hypothetical protein